LAAAPVGPTVVRWLGWLLAAVLCLAVFGLYTAPDFMVMLANQTWACF
jgi:hypothetical protein